MIMYNKHYENQGFCFRLNKCDKAISVRLSSEEIKILNRCFPGKNVSYQIRSIIHAYDRFHC